MINLWAIAVGGALGALSRYGLGAVISNRAYTTFSTFGYEVITLLEGGSLLTAGLYTLSSIVVGFSGVALGISLARVR